jgi:hypothetical protein
MWVPSPSTENEPSIEHPPRPNPPRNRLSRLIVGILFLGVLAVLGYIFWPRPNPAIPTPTQRTIISPSRTPQVLLNLPTSEPNVVIADTLEPSQIPPTHAPKAYYNQGEAVVFKPDVYMYLDDGFSRQNSSCGGVGMEWGVAVYIKNESDSEFNLRFNTGGFSAKDDTGTTYPLFGSGLANSGYTNGLDKTQQMRPKSEQHICIAFNGEIPLSANHIDITADFISGVGPVTFRKDI